MVRRRTVLGGLAAGGASSAAGCLGSLPLASDDEPLEVTTDWPRVEYDPAATGQQQAVTGPADEPSIRWDAEIPVDDGYVPATLVVDGTVIVAGGSTVTALEGADGTQVWQTELFDDVLMGGGRGYYCSAAAGDDYLFVGTHRGLYALALARDGAIEWSHEVEPDPGSSGVFRSPAVVDETVYFCTAKEREVCAYTTDGDERWRASLEGAPTGGPAVSDGNVFVGDETGIRSLSTDGDDRWHADIGRVTVTPAAIGPTVYGVGMTDAGYALVNMSAETGDERWRTAGPSIVGSPALFDSESNDDYLAVPSWFGTVFLYDRDAGTVQWGAPLGSIGSPRFPAADGRHVYAAAESRIVCFRPWAGRKWDLEVDGGNGTVAVVDGALFVATTGGRCYAIA